jgi:glucan phosphorylase
MSDAAQPCLPKANNCAAEIEHKLLGTVAAEPSRATTADLYQALSQVAREQLAQRWVEHPEC